MAEYGEWNRKGATLSDVTATKEYGVSRDFIVNGIQAGKLEYREGAIWGNPYLRILRSQLEQYIAEELGADRLSSAKTQTRAAQDQEGNDQSQEETGRASDSKDGTRESYKEVAKCVIGTGYEGDLQR